MIWTPSRRIIVPSRRVQPRRIPTRWNRPAFTFNSGNILTSDGGVQTQDGMIRTGEDTDDCCCAVMDRYIQARDCQTRDLVDVWFKICPTVADAVCFDSPAGAQLIWPFWFTVDGTHCLTVDNGSPISTTPGTVISNLTDIDIRLTCYCFPPPHYYYPVFNCCGSTFVGWIETGDFLFWQSDNSTSYVTGTDGVRTCWYVDTSVSRALDPSAITIVSFSGLGPVVDCTDTSCCCCGAGCCPAGTVLTLGVTWDFNIPDDGSGNPGIGHWLGSMSIPFTKTSAPGDPLTPSRINSVTEGVSSDPLVDFFIVGCNAGLAGTGGLYVQAGSSVQVNGSTASAQIANPPNPDFTPFTDDVSASGSFGFFTGNASGAAGATGSWTVELTGC